jgi:hypothetical protein
MPTPRPCGRSSATSPTGPSGWRFVTDSRLDEPDVRVVTFADGTVLRERLIALDDELRRLVYSAIGDTMQPAHDNASMQVVPHGDGRSRFVWIHDVRPDELTIPMAAGMDHGLNIFKQALESTKHPG